VWCSTTSSRNICDCVLKNIEQIRLSLETFHLRQCKPSFHLISDCQMGHVRRKCLDFVKRNVDGEFPTNHHSSWNFFYPWNVGMSVKPQLLVPTHLLLAKLPPELPATTIKTQLSSSVCERTIHQVGWFPQLVGSHRLVSCHVDVLPWVDSISLQPFTSFKEPRSEGIE